MSEKLIVFDIKVHRQTYNSHIMYRLMNSLLWTRFEGVDIEALREELYEQYQQIYPLYTLKILFNHE